MQAVVNASNVRELTTKEVELTVTEAAHLYFESRRLRVDAFVDRHFSLAGSLTLHRRAVGRDVVKVHRVKKWPSHRQEDVARLIERMEEIGVEVYQLSDEERELIDEGLAGSIVSDAEMEKFWNRHRV